MALLEVLADQHAARRRDETLEFDLAVLVGLRDAGDDLAVQRHRLGLEGLVDLGYVGEARQLLDLLAAFVLDAGGGLSLLERILLLGVLSDDLLKQ